MKSIRYLATTVVLLLLFGACEDFVQDVDPPIDNVEDWRLDAIGELDFLADGVRARFATTFDRLGVQGDGLSDALVFDRRATRATYPTFEQIDVGIIQLDNNSIDGVLLDLGEVRFFSDDLVSRASELETAAEELTSDDEALLEEAYFTGYFYGGIARYCFAVYFGLSETVGGGVIDAGPFIPSADMLDLAMTKLTAALDYASDYEVRVIHSLMAKIELINGDYTAVATHAGLGLAKGDQPFTSVHSIDSANEYWSQAGLGRLQWVVDGRFKAYVDANALEESRIPLLRYSSDLDLYYQNKYPDQEDPIPFISWQENELMLAECEVRAGTGDPLARINLIRTDHSLETDTGAVYLDAISGAVDLDLIFEERDKELFCTGTRLIDQRREGGPGWHLAAGTWQYLAITERERNANPNLPTY